MIPERPSDEAVAEALYEAAVAVAASYVRVRAAEARAELHEGNALRWKRAAFLNLALLITVAVANVVSAVVS